MLSQMLGQLDLVVLHTRATLFFCCSLDLLFYNLFYDLTAYIGICRRVTPGGHYGSLISMFTMSGSAALHFVLKGNFPTRGLI